MKSDPYILVGGRYNLPQRIHVSRQAALIRLFFAELNPDSGPVLGMDVGERSVGPADPH
jgi:DNA-binding XRE family transcriptional regulator